MMSTDQIKAIAADFLRALATVPGLLARWQAESCPAARGLIVRDELGLAHLPTAADLDRMAEYTQPHAAAVASAFRGTDTPNCIYLAQEAKPAFLIVLAHESSRAAAPA